jgi:hypothetical protein
MIEQVGIIRAQSWLFDSGAKTSPTRVSGRRHDLHRDVGACKHAQHEDDHAYGHLRRPTWPFAIERRAVSASIAHYNLTCEPFGSWCGGPAPGKNGAGAQLRVTDEHSTGARPGAITEVRRARIVSMVLSGLRRGAGRRIFCARDHLPPPNRNGKKLNCCWR